MRNSILRFLRCLWKDSRPIVGLPWGPTASFVGALAKYLSERYGAPGMNDFLYLFQGVSYAWLICVPMLVWLAVAYFNRYNAYEALVSIENAPRFEVREPGYKMLPGAPPFRLQLLLINTGKRSARDLEGVLFAIDKPLSVVRRERFSLAGDVPPGSPTPYYRDNVFFSAEYPGDYLALAITFSDAAVPERAYSQVFYFKWHGVQGGTTAPDFVYVTKEERSIIEDQLGNAIASYKTKYLAL